MTLREHPRAQWILLLFDATVWLPLLMVVTGSLQSSVTVALIAVTAVVAVVNDDVRGQTRRLLTVLLTALMQPSGERDQISRPFWRHRTGPWIAAMRIRAMSVAEPRAPVQESAPAI